MSKAKQKATTNIKPHILPKGGSKYYEASQSQNHFPVGVYFENKFGTAPCTYDTEKEMSKGIVHFLEKHGELVYEHIHIPSNTPGTCIYDTGNFWDESEIVENKIFAYKDTIIHLRTVSSRRIKKEESHYSISVSFKPGSPNYIEDYEQFFIKEQIKNVIFTIMKDEHGSIRFDPFEVSIPENYSIKNCYEPEFEAIHENIVNNLNQNDSGLYLFHGDPGTGKTTYIKYLSSLIKRDLIYVPTSFVDCIADPSFLPALLHKKHSVLIIEDAEKALLAREPGDNSSSLVSTILNLTDGIMANVFKLSIIATYNSPRQSIDKALLRKGRLKMEYRFDKLSVKTAQNIMNTVKPEFKVTEPMSLAEIYNIDIIDHCNTKDLVEEKRMGFR